MASSVKNVLDSLTHQVLVESLFGPGCIHLRQLRLQVAIVRVFFFPDYFLAFVSCFVSAYSGELWTPLAMILHFLLSPLLNSFPLSFHTQLHQPSAVDHLLCQPFFSPKKKKPSRLKLSTWCWCAVCFLCWWMDGKCEDTPREEIIPPDPVFTVRSVGRAWDWA